MMRIGATEPMIRAAVRLYDNDPNGNRNKPPNPPNTALRTDRRNHCHHLSQGLNLPQQNASINIETHRADLSGSHGFMITSSGMMMNFSELKNTFN
jgi:hypothetical protein